MSSNPASASQGRFITAIASIVTVLLTIYNGLTKADIDRRAATVQAAQLDLQKLEERLKERAADLDVLREKTTRYSFLRTLLPDLLSSTGTQQVLTINLVRLTLTEEEAARFFNGFTRSTDKALQQVGSEGLNAITQDKNASRVAAEHERKGFDSLATGNVDQAIASFSNADKAYPTFHDTSELARYLEEHRNDLGTPGGKQKVYAEVLKRYSWKAPGDAVAKLRAISKETAK